MLLRPRGNRVGDWVALGLSLARLPQAIASALLAQRGSLTAFAGLVVLVALSACQQAEVVERSEAGQILREHLYRPWGVRDSLHRIGERTYFFNGNRESETTLRRGQKHGEAREYWHNGQLKSEGHYRHDLRHGSWTFYWNRYQASSHGEYREGKKQGPWFEYFESGDLRRRGHYVDDVEMGLWETFSQKGDTLLRNSCFAANDTGSYRSFHPNGQADEVYACLKGKPFGPYTRHTLDGTLALKGQYDSLGRRTGLWVGYHPNGEIASRQGYLGGLWQDSLWEYDSLGHVQRRGHFELGTGKLQKIDTTGRTLEITPYTSGRREGEMQAYFTDGALQARYVYADDTLRSLVRYHSRDSVSPASASPGIAQRGRFVGGQRDSLWVRYHPNGQVAESAIYARGVLHGEQVFFDRSGKVTQRIRYEHGYPAEGRFRGVPGVKPKSIPKTEANPEVNPKAQPAEKAQTPD